MRYSDYSILVVDDEETSRAILFGSLAQEGYTLAQAQSGAEALEQLKIEVFDLVLLDIVMPEQDGIQVLEVMKKDEALRRTPVMMTTASKEAGSVTKCIRLGAVDYIVKPYDTAKIGTRIWRYLTKDKPPKHVDVVPGTLKPGRILVVDSVALSRDTVAARLKQTSHAVEVADSVSAATPLLESFKPSLVLMDIASLGDDGFAFIEQMQKKENGRGFPFAVVTGDRNADTMHRCVKLGAVDYIQKPFEAVKLKHRIDACLLAQQRKKAAAE